MQKIQLSIPEPCHENWQQMTATQQGRFCDSCAKEVIDFSTMTDQQVLNYFSVLTNEKICGRVLSTQLDIPIESPLDPKKKLFWYWNYIVMFFLFFSKSNLVKAQTKGKMVSVPVANPTCTKTMGQMVSGVNIIKPGRIIAGKITDIAGAPVPFAAIKIKGQNVGVSVDQNGQYSIKAREEDVLEISAVGFEPRSFNLNGLNSFDFTLQNIRNTLGGEIVVTGGFNIRRTCGKTTAATQPEYISIFEVKDHSTGLPIANVSVDITRIEDAKTDHSVTDKQGIYKLKRIKKDDGYHMRIFMNGYEANEFTITGKEFNERKTAWEVYLKKTATLKPVDKLVHTSNEKNVHIRGTVTVTSVEHDPIYVLDGLINADTSKIDPNRIESVTVLHGSEAVALFGNVAVYGAIIMTSKKAKILDTVKVRGSSYKRNVYALTGAVSFGRTISGTADTKKGNDHMQPESKFSIYPNPVQRGNSITLILQLIETGVYNIQVTDVNGRIVLKKEISTITKSPKEMLPCDSRWAGGIYYMSVFNDKNQLINKSSFIVQ